MKQNDTRGNNQTGRKTRRKEERKTARKFFYFFRVRSVCTCFDVESPPAVISRVCLFNPKVQYIDKT